MLSMGHAATSSIPLEQHTVFLIVQEVKKQIPFKLCQQSCFCQKELKLDQELHHSMSSNLEKEHRSQESA